MNKLTKEEINKRLNQNDVFNQSGEVDQVSLFHISTNHSPELISEIFDLFFGDLDSVKDLHASLRRLLYKRQYDAVIGILRLKYFALEMDIPYVVEAIFQSDNEKVKGMYLSEFLDDLENTILDYSEDEY